MSAWSSSQKFGAVENILKNSQFWIKKEVRKKKVHLPTIRTLTTILNLYRRDGESARHPYSVLDGLYLGTYPSAPVHRKTFSMLQ